MPVFVTSFNRDLIIKRTLRTVNRQMRTMRTFVISYKVGACDLSTFYNNFISECNKIDRSPSAVVLDIGLRKSSVTRWKAGGMPTDATIRKLANYFRVSPDWLKGETDDPSVGIKKERPADGEALTDKQKEAVEFIKSLSDDDLGRFIAAAKAMLGE